MINQLNNELLSFVVQWGMKSKIIAVYIQYLHVMQRVIQKLRRLLHIYVDVTNLLIFITRVNKQRAQ